MINMWEIICVTYLKESAVCAQELLTKENSVINNKISIFGKRERQCHAS